MGTGKARNPNKPRNKPLGPNHKTKKIKKKKKLTNNNKQTTHSNQNDDKTTVETPPPVTPAEQLSFFLEEFQSANGVRLSSLELEPIKDSCIVELSQELDQDVASLGEHLKSAFGSTWIEALCEGQLCEGEIEPGNPSVLIISTSAIRSLELLRGVQSLTGECPAVKLFSKHMKVEEQVSLLKKRVNIASGTPSRIKKLLDIEALGTSRLAVIVIDMHVDVKGYSLLTLPQVRDEFWDLYKTCLHPRLVQGDLRICLYGKISNPNRRKSKKSKVATE